MPSETWPTIPIQRAILRDFSKWLNRGKAGVYAPEPGKAKLVRFDDDQLSNAVEAYLQEQQDAIHREAL